MEGLHGASAPEEKQTVEGFEAKQKTVIEAARPKELPRQMPALQRLFQRLGGFLKGRETGLVRKETETPEPDQQETTSEAEPGVAEVLTDVEQTASFVDAQMSSLTEAASKIEDPQAKTEAAQVVVETETMAGQAAAEVAEKLSLGGEAEVTAENPLDVIKKRLEEDPKIDAILTNPEILSYTTVRFDLPEHDGRELRPGQRLAFVVPEQFQGRLVRDVILRHRKGEKYKKDIGPDGHDPYGAYSRVELYDTKSDDWKQWSDPKGYTPDKFAEPRSAGDPENEVLHDWIATVGPVAPDSIRVTNVGQSADYSVSQIHGVEIVFFPELEGNTSSQERVYCQGTQFADLPNHQYLPKYGGGSHTEGIYIGAMALNQRGKALYELGTDAGEGVEKEPTRLRIKLEPGKSLGQVEVAVGDTEHLVNVSPKTHRHTRLGYSKLWVGVKRAESQKVEWFIENANIPPQGIIAGAPHLEKSAVEEGDELIIEARDDTAFVMGYKVTYKNEEVK